jgi:hypothetical protein
VTKLHQDMSDAVNVLVHTQPGNKGPALPGYNVQHPWFVYLWLACCLNRGYQMQLMSS